MEIKNILGGMNPYDRTKLDKAEAEQGKGRRDSAPVQGQGGDRVVLSEEAKLRTEAFKAATAAPDVRQDKVAMIKAQIAAGEYRMDSSKIARNLVRDEMDLNG